MRIVCMLFFFFFFLSIQGWSFQIFIFWSKSSTRIKKSKSVLFSSCCCWCWNVFLLHICIWGLAASCLDSAVGHGLESVVGLAYALIFPVNVLEVGLRPLITHCFPLISHRHYRISMLAGCFCTSTSFIIADCICLLARHLLECTRPFLKV